MANAWSSLSIETSYAKKKPVRHMRTMFLDTALDVSSSSTPVSCLPNLRAATSTLSANLIAILSSRLRPQTAHSASYRSAKCGESWVSRMLKKRTKPVQVRELSRKATLLTSHNRAPEREPYSPTKAQLESASVAIHNDIAPDLNREKQRVGSALARGTVNNQQEVGSFNDFIPRQSPVGYEHSMILIGNQTETKSELLRALRCFSRNRFSEVEMVRISLQRSSCTQATYKRLIVSIYVSLTVSLTIIL